MASGSWPHNKSHRFIHKYNNITKNKKDCHKDPQAAKVISRGMQHVNFKMKYKFLIVIWTHCTLIHNYVLLWGREAVVILLYQIPYIVIKDGHCQYKGRFRDRGTKPHLRGTIYFLKANPLPLFSNKDHNVNL